MVRCGKVFPVEKVGGKEDELKVMMDWASDGFKPTGPDGFRPPEEANGGTALGGARLWGWIVKRFCGISSSVI